jgi:hypothetical protein
MPFHCCDNVADFWARPWSRDGSRRAILSRRSGFEMKQLSSLGQALTDPRILSCALVYFCLSAASYGVAFLLPTMKGPLAATFALLALFSNRSTVAYRTI